MIGTTLRIVKAENGFVVLAGEDMRTGDAWQRNWIAKDALELARVIVTQVVLSEMKIDVAPDELDALLKELQ